MGRLKCQALSRPMIEPIHDVVYLCLRQRIEGRPFGHILANQPVGVLVESPLPGMIGMGKIDGRVQRLADRGMVSKLLAVIGRNRLGMPLMGREQGNRGRRHLLGLLGGDFAQHGIARAPFDHRDERPRARTSHHQVDFPIADATFCFDDGRALVDADSVFNLSSGIGFSIAFLAFLLTGTQGAIQRTPRLTIRLDVLVDTLRTQSKTVGCRQPTRNLLGTPLLTQIRFDTLDDRRRHLGRPRLVATTRQRFVVGLAGTIAALPLIAPQLPTNRRGRYRQRRGDALLRMPGFLQRVHLVSLMFGQLVIRSHKRLRRELRLKWPGKIYQLAFSIPATQAIALTR